MAENGNSKEKKNARTRRAPTGEKNSRQQDQVLTGAENPPRVGKIAGPKKEAQAGQRGRKRADSKKAEAKQPAAKKSGGKAGETAGKKKAETSRRSSAKSGR